MNLSLHPEWRAILLRAWSVRFMVLAGLFSGIAASLPLAQPFLNIDPLKVSAAVGIATFLSVVASIGARITNQKNVD